MSNEENGIKDKLEQIDNKLERIKSDTHNVNRILTISNSTIIVQELRKIITGSKIRAAILHLTREEIGAGDLAKAIGIDHHNLPKYMKPFLGNRGYISAMQRGRERFFQRSELVDLVGFESILEFKNLIESWQKDSHR